MIVVVSSSDEIGLFNANKYIITGVGALNVYKTLKNIDRKTPIHNVGFAGSNCIPIGKRVKIGKVRLYHPNVLLYGEPEFDLGGDVPCFTSCDFVEQTDIPFPCVFDMELAFILGMGFENVTAEKVVSDNLNSDEYYEYVTRWLNG